MFGKEPITVDRHIQLPPLKVKPVVEPSKVWRTEGEDTEEEFASSKSVSTYPILAGKQNVRDGDPIADRVFCCMTKNRAIVAVADGCNWGVRPQQAAIRATAAFKDYLSEKHKDIHNLQDAGHFLYRAFSEAHKKIIEGKEDIWEAGTTTLLGGMCFELEQSKEEDPHWGFVCASVGDCKAYLVSHQTGEVTDVTAGNRLDQKDAKDPGGRLGPYIMPQGDPDLRNLQLYFMPCEAGDIIIIVSDGVHDNLDPETLGKSPKEFLLESDSWEKIEKKTAEAVKTQYRNKLIEKLLSGAPHTPTSVTNILLKHCIQLTHNAREYMEKNPNSSQPKDYVNFPGKMDHTTCISFIVGEIKSLSLSPDESGKEENDSEDIQQNSEEKNEQSNALLSMDENGDKKRSSKLEPHSPVQSHSPEKDHNQHKNSKSEKPSKKQHKGKGKDNQSKTDKHKNSKEDIKTDGEHDKERDTRKKKKHKQ